MSEFQEATGDQRFSADDTPTLAGTPQPPAEPSEAPIQQTRPVKRRKRRGLFVLITVLLVVAILGACGFWGYSFAMQRYNELSNLGNQMCNNLEAHQYDALYQHFSDGLKHRFTKDEFSGYGAEIDQFEGAALSCGQATGNHYTFDIGKRTITVASVVNRQGTGTHSGNVRFLLADNAWQVDDFDVGFLGVSLDALKLFDTYCVALTNVRFQSIYTMLAPSLRGASKQDFLQTANLHLDVDGVAKECVLEGIGTKNTETSSTLSLHILRQKHYSVGAMTFGSTPSGWEITAIDPALDGRDLQPVYIANRWCSDIQSQNYKDSFGLFTSKIQKSTSLAVYSAQYSGKQGPKWLNCTVSASSYQGSDRPGDNNVALQTQVHLKNLRTSVQTQEYGQIGFEQEDSQWRIDIVFLCGEFFC